MAVVVVVVVVWVVVVKVAVVAVVAVVVVARRLLELLGVEAEVVRLGKRLEVRPQLAKLHLP